MDANYKAIIIFSNKDFKYEEFEFFGSYREDERWLIFYHVEGTLSHTKKIFNKKYKVEHILSYTVELIPEPKVEVQNGTNLAKR